MSNGKDHMTEYAVRFLGPVQVQWDAGNPPRFRSQRTMALLGYLATEGRPVARDALAALFWPDTGLSKAKANLRRELHNLGNVLPDCWKTDRQTVRFAPGDESRVDVQELLELEDAEQWAEAAELVRGDFLEGVSLEDNLEFETWLLGERERWRQRAERVLSEAIEEAERSGDHDEALRFARRLLQLLPWHEETHRTAMRLLALGGQRSAALRQYERCRQMLQKELGVEVSGETEALYQRICESYSFTLHNIPAPTTSLIGRGDELALLEVWLQDDGVRLITITGAGGVGKTRLALSAAESFLDSARIRPSAPFSDGIYFVRLSPLDDPEQIIPTIAIALDLFIQTGDGRSPSEQLRDYLSRKRILLILDNFEHLLSGSHTLVDVLEAAQDIRILVTSREPTGLKGEQLLPLGGLTYSVPNLPKFDQVGAGHEAAALFLASAARISPGFQLAAADRNHLNQLCRLVEGMPLALELAAVWVDSLPLPDIVEEIERSPGFLEVDGSDLVQRHRSMEAVFDSAWRRLSSAQQAILAKLSVFRGGFTLDAARFLTGASNRSLSLLVKRSLLRFEQSQGRYYLHELLRQYATIRLDEDPEAGRAIRQRHLIYFCQLAAEGEQNLQGGDQIGWSKRLLLEVNNLRTAIEWGVDHDLETASRLAAHLYYFWFSSGQSKVGERLYERILSRKSELPANLRAWVLIGYTEVIWLEAKLDVIKAFSNEALPLFQATNDAAGLELTYFNLAFLDSLQGDMESALRKIDLAIQHARSGSASTWYLSHALMGKAMFLLAMGEYDAVRRIAAEDLPLCQERGDRVLASYDRARLARIALFEGKYDKARKLSRQVLAFAQDVKNRRLEAFQYLHLGQISLAEGDLLEAIAQLEDAISVSTDGYSLDVLIEAHLRLGDTYCELAKYGSARNSFQCAATLCLDLDWSEHAADCLEGLAYLRWRQEPGAMDAVRWLATASSWREEANIRRAQPNQARVRRLLKEMRQQMKEDDLAKIWQTGAARSLAESLSDAVL